MPAKPGGALQGGGSTLAVYQDLHLTPVLPCARDSLAASTKRRTETGRLPEVPKAAIGVDRQAWVP
jgi:hypothetical protein